MASLHPRPNSSSWPNIELEYVLSCPVCRSKSRSILYQDLVDDVYLVAPGKWTLYRCSLCHSAYLSPRPKPFYISKAYLNYYTHSSETKHRKRTKSNPLISLRHSIANGYANQRYGTSYQPASFLGEFLGKLVPRIFQIIDIRHRFLPKPTQGDRILDVGCGNGSFLSIASDAGWQVTGLDPDNSAVLAARKSGLNIYLGHIDELSHMSSCFDVITLSHVIEHVHDPSYLLSSLHRLLKDGGLLYLETPNIESCGHKLFGRNWRGIEAPRHLVLFNPRSLAQLLSVHGFDSIKTIRNTSVFSYMYLASCRIAGRQVSIIDRFLLPLKRPNDNALEFITLIAKKKSL